MGNISFRGDGKLKLLIIVGTRPEIIRLSAVIKKCRRYFDVILAHTGQNYDYNLNGVFFRDLELDDPEEHENRPEDIPQVQEVQGTYHPVAFLVGLFLLHHLTS